MLTKNDIRRLTDSAVYMRGAGLYKHGDVDDFYVENIEDGEWYLGAKVMGGSKYDVELIYDDKSAGLSHSFQLRRIMQTLHCGFAGVYRLSGSASVIVYG